MKLLAFSTLVIAIVISMGSTAAAGTYSIHACTDSDNRNNLFAPFVSRVGEATPTQPGACHAAPSGLRTRSGDRSPDAGWFEFCAPPGTTVKALEVSHRTTWKGSGYAVHADSGSCGPYKIAGRTGLPASMAGFSDSGWIHWKSADWGGRGVRLITSCDHEPCHGAGSAETNWRNLTFEIDDPVPPTVNAAPTDWLRGTAQPLAVNATDNAGVERIEAGVAGRPDLGWTADARQTTCDPTRSNRCPTTMNLPATLDTTKLPDGTSDLRISAQDVAANNSPVVSHPLRVDNTPPTATLVRATTDYTRTIAWRVTDGHSGVDGSSLVAEYRVDGTSRPLSGGSWNAADGTYSAVLPSAVADGTVEVVLRGADGAMPGGNRFEQTASVTTDTAAPGAPSIDAPTGWINRASAADAVARFSTPEPAPVSGVAGYSVTTDGSQPDTTPDVTDQLSLADLPDGTVTLRARSVSRASVASVASSRQVRIDRTDPTLTLLGAGDPLTPHPGPITVTISARDAASGMGDAEPPEEGGFVAYRLDGGEEVRSPGDEVQVAIDGEGTHLLGYRAVDRAGNASRWHERGLTIRPAEGSGKERRPFFAVSHNPGVAFRAAPTFSGECPAVAAVQADRDVAIGEAVTGSGDLRVRSTAGVRAVSLVGFPLPAARGCAVASARLRLFVIAGAAARLDVRRAGSAWTEGGATWDLRPGSTGPAAGGQAVGQRWVDIDVTSLVNSLYRLGDNGFELSSEEGDLTLASREAEIAVRPELVLEFE